jgi:HEAT repeat protein
MKRLSILLVLVCACEPARDIDPAPTVAAAAPAVATPGAPPPGADAPVDFATLAPRKTRAGHLRFSAEELADPRATTAFLARLTTGNEPEAVRAALVEALPRTGGAWAHALDGLYTRESTAVRELVLFVAARAPEAEGLAVLRRGLAEPTAELRAEAVRSTAAHPAGARLAGELTAALATDDPDVRTEAARALGVHRIATARTALLARLDDAVADVRLEALRALEQIAPDALAGHAALSRLAADADPRIAQLAAQLVAR